MRTWEHEKVWQASLHLEGIAAEWFYTLPCFSEFINMRFRPPLHTDLHRTRTVEDYQRQFLKLLCRCDDMIQQQQTNMFTAGLGEPLRRNVELVGPTNLQHALHLARAFERRLASASTATWSSSSNSSSRSGLPNLQHRRQADRVSVVFLLTNLQPKELMRNAITAQRNIR